MSRRRFLNLVVQSWADTVYSLRRIDPHAHLFYPSTAEAAAAAAKIEKTTRSMPSLGPLPEPIAKFEAQSPGERPHDAGLGLFALMAPRGGCEGRIVVSDGFAGGDTALYDADEKLYLTLPRLNQRKGPNPVCVSITHPGAGKDSLYVLDRFPGVRSPSPVCCHPADCFEVLEPSRRRWKQDSHHEDGYQPWRLLPPPPVLHKPGFGYRPPRITSYTTVVDAGGCTSILMSFGTNYGPDHTVGTYRFDTARREDSGRYTESWMHVEEWRRVGDWVLPFDGRALHVPELGLWLGFSARNGKPHRLCAVDDLTMAAALDDHGRPAPTVRHVWGEGDEEFDPPGTVEWWKPPMHRTVVNLGSGRFCVAQSFQVDRRESGQQFAVLTGERFAVLTGVEIVRGDDGGEDGRGSVRMVKHKSARYDCTNEFILWVL